MSDDQAFVIMQVGAKESSERKRADELYQHVISPALAQHDLRPYRADLDLSPGAITPKLLTELLKSRVVIADLTGRNVNVYYELGITHSYARPLITIADTVRSLPFDTKDERTIEIGAYPETGLAYAQGEQAKSSLLASLAIVLQPDYVSPSPLREIAGTASLDALAPENPLASEIGQIREALEEIRGSIADLPRSQQRRIPEPVAKDIRALRGSLEHLVTEGVLDASEAINAVITTDSSEAHDNWARSLLNLPVRSPAAQTEDPWGPQQTTGDPWGSPPVEDPPF